LFDSLPPSSEDKGLHVEGGGGHHFMMQSVSETWGISEEFNLYLTGEKSKFFSLAS